MRDHEEKPGAKPLVWMGDSLEMVRRFPPLVKDEIGFALYQAQIGKKHVNAKPMKGLGSGVLGIVSDYRGDTFRAVYMVKLAKKVYVLHAFQKKSKSGIATPGPDIELIKHRLKRAVQLHMQGGT
jgi:phage-related protein